MPLYTGVPSGESGYWNAVVSARSVAMAEEDLD
jgi:hypothetical protein